MLFCAPNVMILSEERAKSLGSVFWQNLLFNFIVFLPIYRIVSEITAREVRHESFIEKAAVFHP